VRFLSSIPCAITNHFHTISFGEKIYWSIAPIVQTWWKTSSKYQIFPARIVRTRVNHSFSTGWLPGLGTTEGISRAALPSTTKEKEEAQWKGDKCKYLTAQGGLGRCGEA
jgi:hypothetical protein